LGEFLCCAAFAALLFYLAISGRYLSYVAPRMAPYLYFTATILALWAGFSLTGLFRPQHRIRSGHCAALAIPVLLLLLPHSPLSAADLTYNYAGGTPGSVFAASGALGGGALGGGAPGGGAPASGAPASGLSSDGRPAAGLFKPIGPAVPADLPGLNEAAKMITVPDDQFYFWLDEIGGNPDAYAGYRIAMTGFVLKDPQMLGPEEFVPARLGMSCCVADLMPLGMICEYGQAAELTADTWVTVEGVLEVGEYEGWPEPRVRVTSVAPAAAVEGYIYLF
jgi:putative membrane protein